LRTFEKLTNRYELTCTLLAEESLHFGSGLASATTDAPFILENGIAFLPGSGMRGALRSRVESIARGLPNTERCCILFEDKDSPNCDAGNEKRRKLWESASPRELDELIQKGLSLCPVCELFGSTIKAAKLKISDAVPLSNAWQITRRDGVGINRDTGTAEEHIKYDFEVLGRGCRFTCRIFLENAETNDLGLLYILLSEWKAGLDMGGKKTRGLGRVRMESFEVKWFEDMTAFLRGTVLTDVKVFEKALRDGFEAFLKSGGKGNA
jgi:CRISPR-associated protein Csm3